MTVKPPERSSILGPDGKPIVHGAPTSYVKQALAYDEQIQNEDQAYLELLKRKRIKTPMDKVEKSISFWKPLYFDYLIEGRHINGIEAHELGNPERNEKPNPVPFIAMCNLMALEALRMLGDDTPTTTNPHKLATGSEKEQAIADFWKKSFQPLALQAEWAWSGVLAILVGEPYSWKELLLYPQNQLP